MNKTDAGMSLLELADYIEHGKYTTLDNLGTRNIALIVAALRAAPARCDAGIIEACARIVEGNVLQEHYREWPPFEGNRPNDSSIVKHCDMLAAQIRALSLPATEGRKYTEVEVHTAVKATIADMMASGEIIATPSQGGKPVTAWEHRIRASLKDPWSSWHPGKAMPTGWLVEERPLYASPPVMEMRDALDKLAERVMQLCDAGAKSLTIGQVIGLIAFVRDGVGDTSLSATDRGTP